MCKLAAVGQMIHKYDEIICSIHQGGHPASHHDPSVGGPWWGSFAKTTGGADSLLIVIVLRCYLCYIQHLNGTQRGEEISASWSDIKGRRKSQVGKTV